MREGKVREDLPDDRGIVERGERTAAETFSEDVIVTETQILTLPGLTG
jgi:hypothetical protein